MVNEETIAKIKALQQELDFKVTENKKLPFEISNINRRKMAKIIGKLGMTKGAEIGVAQGWHAKVLCEEIPGLELYAVDIWGRYEGYREYTDRIDKYFQEAKERLAPYNTHIIQKFSVDAAKDIPNESLDFVYIDGAHDLKNAVDDICEWSKKVKIGGIVFGHDYKRWKPGRSKYVVDVKDAIQAFTYAKNVHPWFELKNDIEDSVWKRDVPGWCFVRSEEDYIEFV